MAQHFRSGFATHTTRIRLAIALALCVTAQVLAEDMVASPAGSDDLLFAEMPVVLTASRLQQPQAEAPAAVTIIDHALIRASGARTIPEILRLVPGMQIGLHHGHQASVSYHGVFDENAHRMQVLIDGRSVFEPALARILWTDLPIAVEDIQRIEITRGPNSALYGANAFTAIINIITNTAGDVRGAELSVRHGDKDFSGKTVRDSLLRIGTGLGDSADLRLSLGSRADDGFDQTRDGEPRFDGYDSAFINGQIDINSATGSRFDLQFGHKRGDKEIQFLDGFEPEPFHSMDDNNSYILGHWYQDINSAHELRWQVYWNHNEAIEEWRTCPYRVYMSNELRRLFELDPAYTAALLAAVGGGNPPPPPPSAQVAALLPALFARIIGEGLATTCGMANQNIREQRFDIELQDTWRVNDDMRLVSGLSWRQDEATSETYLGGAQRNQLWRVFGNLEYRLTGTLVSNLGAMYESDQLSGSSLSPRAALNWTFSSNHTLRAIYSKALRTPDMFEENGQFDYTIRHLEQPVNGNDRSARYYYSSHSNDNLHAEEIRASELGLYGNYIDAGLSWDFKLFRDHATDLVAGDTRLERFNLDNSGEALIEGAELEINWRPHPVLRLHAGLSTLDLETHTANYMRRTTPKHTYNFLMALALPYELESSLSYYEMDQLDNVRYQLAGLRLAKTWAWLDSSRFELAVDYRYRLDDKWYFDKDNQDEDNGSYWLSATLVY